MTTDTIDPRKIKSLLNNSFQLFKLTPTDDNIDKLINYLQSYKSQQAAVVTARRQTLQNVGESI